MVKIYDLKMFVENLLKIKFLFGMKKNDGIYLGS